MRAWQLIYRGGMALAALLYLAVGWVIISRCCFPLRIHAATQNGHLTTPAIVIHHTATPPVVNGRIVDATYIDALHARRGFHITDQQGRIYHIGYHFLVLQDGTIQRGRPEYLPGAHAHGYPNTLGIALVGNFESSSNHGESGSLTPPPAQLAAAERLTRELMAKYGFASSQVYLHRDLCPTACPGDRFPRQEFFRDIAQPR